MVEVRHYRAVDRRFDGRDCDACVRRHEPGEAIVVTTGPALARHSDPPLFLEVRDYLSRASRLPGRLAGR